MTIFRPNFSDIDEGDVEQLLTSGQAEGVQVEFKRDIYGNSDSDKKEYLKDISSFANTAGGHLLIGIDENQGIASAISPFQGDPDAALQRLEQIARTAIEPRVFGIQMKAVPLTSGGSIFVIRIPKSWNPPHRVSFQGTNRFYLRSSAGAHEASVEELRAIFSNGPACRIECLLTSMTE